MFNLQVRKHRLAQTQVIFLPWFFEKYFQNKVLFVRHDFIIVLEEFFIWDKQEICDIIVNLYLGNDLYVCLYYDQTYKE